MILGSKALGQSRGAGPSCETTKSSSPPTGTQIEHGFGRRAREAVGLGVGGVGGGLGGLHLLSEGSLAWWDHRPLLMGATLLETSFTVGAQRLRRPAGLLLIVALAFVVLPFVLYVFINYCIVVAL